MRHYLQYSTHPCSGWHSRHSHALNREFEFHLGHTWAEPRGHLWIHPPAQFSRIKPIVLVSYATTLVLVWFTRSLVCSSVNLEMVWRSLDDWARVRESFNTTLDISQHQKKLRHTFFTQSVRTSYTHLGLGVSPQRGAEGECLKIFFFLETRLIIGLYINTWILWRVKHS